MDRLAIRAIALGLFIVVAAQSPGLAAARAPDAVAKTVYILHLYYYPETITIGVGDDLTWVNTMTDMPMTATSDGVRDGTHSRRGIGLFDTGMLDPQASFTYTFFAAGIYPYQNTMAPAQTGSLSVAIRTAPGAGSSGTRFHVIVASADAPPGFVYDVQMKEPFGTFGDRRVGVTGGTPTFDSTGAPPGVYTFRSRLHRLWTDETSGWSPGRSVTVQ